MEESKPDHGDSHNEKLEDRLSEATSKETLGDLEQAEKISDSQPDKASDETAIPSPDGTPSTNEGGGRADDSDTGGPI